MVGDEITWITVVLEEEGEKKTSSYEYHNCNLKYKNVSFFIKALKCWMKLQRIIFFSSVSKLKEFNNILYSL